MAPSAVQLKEQGNALFTQKDFVNAHAKYTEAIAIDGQNAVLYANRSACSFGMGKYSDAVKDAHQATCLNPTYAKGWSRLATAHDAALEFSSAAYAWQKALSALPKTNLTPGETQQKEQYSASFQKALQYLEVFTSISGVTTGVSEKVPWKAAMEMLPALQAAGCAMFSSSAYVIYHAHMDFSQGVEYMNMLKKVPMQGAPDGYATVGHTEALTLITNGVLRDRRALHMDGIDWSDRFGQQVSFEVEKCKSWTAESFEEIKKQALQRLEKDGWQDVRLALAVVIRARLMCAIMDDKFRGTPCIAIERLEEILEFLHWGRRIWRDVSKDDRGTIFQDAFVRGVKMVYLETLQSLFVQVAAANKRALCDTLIGVLREMVEDTEKEDHQPFGSDPVDQGFVLSFYVYPVAEAMAGYCFLQKAQLSENLSEQMTWYAMAIEQYNQAAKLLPEDDEKYCWCLCFTIEPLLKTGASKDTVMEVVGKLRAAMPKMQKIWVNSAMAKVGRDALIERALRDAESKFA